MTFYAGSKLRVVDLDITLTAAADAVTFADAKDGVLGIRMRPVCRNTEAAGTSPTPTDWRASGNCGAGPPIGAITPAR